MQYNLCFIFLHPLYCPLFISIREVVCFRAKAVCVQMTLSQQFSSLKSVFFDALDISLRLSYIIGEMAFSWLNG